jgi:hypothetical protein
MPKPPVPWRRSPERAALHALYAEVDALLADARCACSDGGVGSSPEAQCCHFGVTGREPYPTAVELEEVRHALRASPPPRRDPKRLPLAELRACPLLSSEGRCTVYASRPFGCRTFFCDLRQPRAVTKEVAALGRRIADLSARFAPRDPGPRPLVKALAETLRPPSP